MLLFTPSGRVSPSAGPMPSSSATSSNIRPICCLSFTLKLSKRVFKSSMVSFTSAFGRRIPLGARLLRNANTVFRASIRASSPGSISWPLSVILSLNEKLSAEKRILSNCCSEKLPSFMSSNVMTSDKRMSLPVFADLPTFKLVDILRAR